MLLTVALCNVLHKLGASLISGHVVSVLYLRECPFQPAASRADDLPQRTEHLTQEVLQRREDQTTVNTAQHSPTVHVQLSASASLPKLENIEANI